MIWHYPIVPCPPAFEAQWHALALEILRQKETPGSNRKDRIPKVHLATTKECGVRDAACSNPRPGRLRVITDFRELVTCKHCLQKMFQSTPHERAKLHTDRSTE